MISLPVGIAIVLACLGLQAFFSGSEMALVSADSLKLSARAKEGNRGAELALSMLEAETRLLGTCLIGTNLSLITGTTVASLVILARPGAQPWLPTAIMVPMLLVFGEALPKTVGNYHGTTLAPYLARPLRIAQLLFTPLLALVTAWDRLLSSVTGVVDSAGVTRQEILLLLDEKSDGPIAEGDVRLIKRIFQITETPVEDVMTPLVQVHALAEDADVAEAVQAFIRTGHSRLPIYRDRVDNLIGVLHHQDVLFGDADASITDLVREASYVPESKRVDELIREMREIRVHFMVVVDEYGGGVGVITLEDLLEEVVGEIHDERDRDELRIRQLSANSWRMQAQVEIEQLADRIGREVPEGDDYETVAGLLLSHLGRIPEIGEVVDIEGLRFRIEEADARAIRRVHLIVLEES
ncbi:MAG: HlyC/CorC family transporter [Deltaproteobacteria bacterium]|nr:MAG: HlyC/CorC family transporter [Deltaproteobacteria bacterium]